MSKFGAGQPANEKPQAEFPAAEPTRAVPSHVILETDWAGHISGTVLAVDADRLAAMDEQGAKYREATAEECRLGGPR